MNLQIGACPGRFRGFLFGKSHPESPDFTWTEAGALNVVIYESICGSVVNDLKAAFKAFKKRLQLTQLDEESKLTRRPTTSGQPSAIVAIVPPNQFGKAVWDELVKQGKLKKAGQGMYEIVEWWTL